MSRHQFGVFNQPNNISSAVRLYEAFFALKNSILLINPPKGQQAERLAIQSKTIPQVIKKKLTELCERINNRDVLRHFDNKQRSILIESLNKAVIQFDNRKFSQVSKSDQLALTLSNKQPLALIKKIESINQAQDQPQTQDQDQPQAKPVVKLSLFDIDFIRKCLAAREGQDDLLQLLSKGDITAEELKRAIKDVLEIFKAGISSQDESFIGDIHKLFKTLLKDLESEACVNDGFDLIYAKIWRVVGTAPKNPPETVRVKDEGCSCLGIRF